LKIDHFIHVFRKMKRSSTEDAGGSSGGKGPGRKRAKTDLNGTPTTATASREAENRVKEHSSSNMSELACNGTDQDPTKTEESSADHKARSSQKCSDGTESKEEKTFESMKVDPGAVQARMINKALGLRKAPTKEKKPQETTDQPSHHEPSVAGHAGIKKEISAKPVEPPRRVQKNPDFLQEHRTRYVDQKMGRSENRKVKFIHGNYDSYYNYRNPGRSPIEHAASKAPP
jgi:hypothetical protein